MGSALLACIQVWPFVLYIVVVEEWVTASSCCFRYMSLNLGATRSSKLASAARKGKYAPPADLRFLKKPFVGNTAEKTAVRSEILSFLQGLYESVAETLPDIRDDTEPDDASVQVFLHAESAEQDEYASALNGAQPNHELESQVKPLSKQSKPRKKKKSVVIQRSHQEIRYLPPGTLKEYWHQLNMMREPPLKKIAFSYFWRAAPLEYHAACLVVCVYDFHAWPGLPRFGMRSSRT